MGDSKTCQDALNIYYCGYQECAQGHSFGPAVRSHYLIHFILKGKGYYQTGGQTFDLEAGDAFLIRPREVTFYEADQQNPWVYAWIAFSGAEAERLLAEYHLGETRLLCKWEEPDILGFYFEAMNRAYKDSTSRREELLGWFYLIFSKIVKDPKKQSLSDQDYFKQAKDYMIHNFEYGIQVTDAARYVGIDRTYLFRLFKKYAQVSPKQFLTDCRMEAAKDMLRYTRLNVTQIALSCGFQDSSAFCRTFSARTGVSPLQYRGSCSLRDR